MRVYSMDNRSVFVEALSAVVTLAVDDEEDGRAMRTGKQLAKLVAKLISDRHDGSTVQWRQMHEGALRSVYGVQREAIRAREADREKSALDR